MDYKSLVEKIKEKDEAAFEAIYHDTKYVIYSMIISIVKDRFLAEDIMQDVYIKMVQKINYYNPKYKFINWLITIAKNEALDNVRRKKEVLLDDDKLDYFSNPEKEKKTEIDIGKHLKVLDQEEKQIVLLKIVQDLKHREIAEIVDKPLGTVIWIYNKAIKKMKKEAKENEN